MRKSALVFAFILSISPLFAQPTKTKTSTKAKPKSAQVKTEELTPLQKTISQLKSQDPVERRIAVEDLGRMREPRSSPALVVALSDEDSAVRASAARALGLMRSQDGLKELQNIVGNDQDPQVRQSAAVALGFIGDPSSVEPLTKALKDSHTGTRYAANQALANLKVPAAVPALIDCLKDPEPQFRRAAAQSLGEIGDPSAISAIKPLLDDKDPSLRLAAVKSLGKLKDTSSAATFKKLLKKKNVPEMRVAAAQALARQNNDSGRSTVLEVLSNRSLEVPVRLQAVQALRDMPHSSLKKPIKELHGAEPEGPVKQALEALLAVLPQ